MKKQSVIAALMLIASSFAITANAATPKSLNAFQEGERLVYGKLVEAYRRGSLGDMYHQRQVLERNYPGSIHLDNALYLTGMLEFQNGRLGEAVRTFNTVTDRYPKSGKRPAALFGLAMSYKRLGLNSLSTKVLSSLSKEYPGSPESSRAQLHLKMEKQNTVKR